jgi:hypothetical protein
MDELEEEERDDRAGRGIYATTGPFALPPDLLESIRRRRRGDRRATRAWPVRPTTAPYSIGRYTLARNRPRCNGFPPERMADP